MERCRNSWSAPQEVYDPAEGDDGHLDHDKRLHPGRPFFAFQVVHFFGDADGDMSFKVAGADMWEVPLYFVDGDFGDGRDEDRVGDLFALDLVVEVFVGLDLVIGVLFVPGPDRGLYGDEEPGVCPDAPEVNEELRGDGAELPGVRAADHPGHLEVKRPHDAGDVFGGDEAE